MRIGQLRTPVLIQKPKPSATEGGYGHIDLNDPANWVSHCERRGECVPTGSREVVVGGSQVRSFTTWRIKLRFDPLTRIVQPRMRVQWREEQRTVNIEASFDPDGTKREWWLEGVEQQFTAEKF